MEDLYAKGSFILSIYIYAMGSDAIVDHEKIAVYSAIVRFIFSIFGCVLVYTVSRRQFIISTSLASSISAAALAIFLYSREGIKSTSIDLYVPVVCLFIYFACSAAFILMTGIMIGELLLFVYVVVWVATIRLHLIYFILLWQKYS